MGSFDKSKAVAFADRLMSMYSSGMICHLIDLGSRTGLLEAAASGPATSPELAERAGLDERYVREWLGAMVTAEVFDYDDGTATYSLAAEHAACLTGTNVYNSSAIASLVRLTATLSPRVEIAFHNGEGVGYHEQPDELFELIDRMSRARYDALLLRAYLPTVPGLPEFLERGAAVVDVGCGTGHAANVIAQGFPKSTVVGIDTSDRALVLARREASALGLANVRFELAEVESIADATYDLVTAFDVIHDLAQPGAALTAIRRALTTHGTFLMYDVGAPSGVEQQVGLPWAPLMYGMSVFGCLGYSLAGGGAGLGNMWGRETAEAMVRQAGFSDVSIHDARGDPVNAIYVCRP